ncbi:hypothetical protein CASFOL_026540 [Castilleja foliolosa]|uniref:RING-type E3 ubiquitin transferase n=1 Tax=Castilleja foliolosa TaxID=1961234 RepID=A0ABD3CHC6_9LAMI
MNRTAPCRRHETRRRLNRTPPIRPETRIPMYRILTEAGPDVTTYITERSDPNDSLLTWLIDAINTVQSQDPTFQISRPPQEPETTMTLLDHIRRNSMGRVDIFDRYLSGPIRWIDFNDSSSSVEVESEDDQPKGLSEGTISKYLKTMSVDEIREKDIDGDRKICAVCRDDMCGSQRDDKVAILDKCGHEFHYCCLEKWLRKKNICPLCRRTAIFPLQD